MPLGIISDKEFESELLDMNDSIDNVEPLNEPTAVESELIIDSNNIITSADIVQSKGYQNSGRRKNDVEVPESLRKIIGETAIMEGNKSALKLASSLGISSSSTNSYKNGKTSPNNNHKDNDLIEYLNERKNKVAKKAMNKLNMALSNLDEPKMQGLEARELSGVAKDMAIIVKQMEPTVKSDAVVNPVSFQFVSIVQNSENQYQRVVAKDNY